MSSTRMRELTWSIWIPMDDAWSCSAANSCLTLCDPMDCRIPCPLLSPGGCSNSRPLSRWCHPTISSSDAWNRYYYYPHSTDKESEPQFSSFSRSVVYKSLWPHEPQHARPPRPSPTLGVHPNPCPSSWWCHPTISSSVVPFSSCPQSFPASVSVPMSQLFASDGQSIRDPASASVLPMNTQDWSPLG